MKTKGVTNFTMSARVYRKATGKWENLGVITKSKKSSIIRRIKKWLRF